MKTVKKRQFQIQQHQLWIFLHKLLNHMSEIFDLKDLISPGFQMSLYYLYNNFVIFYY